MIVVDKTAFLRNDIAATECQGDETACGLVETKRYSVVAQEQGAGAVGHSQMARAFNCQRRQRRTLSQSKLSSGIHMACGSKRRGITTHDTYVQHHFFTLYFSLGQIETRLESEQEAIACCNWRQAQGLGLLYIAIDQRFILQIKTRQVAECIGIGQFHADGIFAFVHIDQCKLDILIGRLDLHQFCTGRTSGRNETIAAEIALMRAGEVITGAQTTLIRASFNLCRLINGLVNPIPNTKSDDRATTLGALAILPHVTGRVAH